MITKDIKAPKELKGESLRAWKRFAAVIPTIEEEDIPALQIMAETWAEWHDANEHVKTDGAVLTTRNGYAMPSPYVKIRLNASTHLQKLFDHFGMTPASRVRTPHSIPLEDL